MDQHSAAGKDATDPFANSTGKGRTINQFATGCRSLEEHCTVVDRGGGACNLSGTQQYSATSDPTLVACGVWTADSHSKKEPLGEKLFESFYCGK